MRWISKFDFFTLYRKKVTNGHFNPGSAITIRKIEIPDENTIVLGAGKDMHDFTGVAQIPNAAVLFISKDKGQTYHEVTTGEEVFEDMYSATNYTMVQAYTLDRLAVKHHKIFLLNNTTFELRKAIEFTNDGEYYGYFDGKYIIKKNKSESNLINMFNIKEQYTIPNSFYKDKDVFYHLGDGIIRFMKDLEIVDYNIKTKETRVVKKLPKKYDYYWYDDGEETFGLDNVPNGENFTTDVFDNRNRKIFTLDSKNIHFYRYKNFMCDYTKIGPSPEIRYSYDYGKTWKVHHVREFSILQKIFGFYKDQFLVTEGIFFHGESPESGGRVMVGEFVK